MYTKPTTTLSSITLEKGLLVAASGSISDCAVKVSSTSFDVESFTPAETTDIDFGEISF